MNHRIFDALFMIAPIFIGMVFIASIAIIISPKLRGKLMSRQIKSAKYMLEKSKEDLEQIGTIAGAISVNTKENILNQHEDTLKDTTRREANIRKEGVEITARAIKEGLNSSGKKGYCKHCGESIDGDSKFCKSCGKEQ